MTPQQLNDIQTRSEASKHDISDLLAHIAHQDLELRTHRATYTQMNDMVMVQLQARNAPADILELPLAEQLAWVFGHSVMIVVDLTAESFADQMGLLINDLVTMGEQVLVRKLPSEPQEPI